eukprot:6513653-Alexandrium_andersonii.AAC.1
MMVATDRASLPALRHEATATAPTTTNADAAATAPLLARNWENLKAPESAMLSLTATLDGLLCGIVHPTSLPTTTGWPDTNLPGSQKMIRNPAIRSSP